MSKTQDCEVILEGADQLLAFLPAPVMADWLSGAYAFMAAKGELEEFMNWMINNEIILAHIREERES